MTEYGKIVKKKLVDIDKTQVWLIKEVKSRRNCYLNSAYLSHLLSGERNAPAIKAEINKILEIEEN